MIWVILIAIFVYVTYRVFTDQEKNVTNNVSNYGGMEKKYDILIAYIESGGIYIIKDKTTKDSVTLASATARFRLEYNMNGLDVFFNGYVPVHGNIKKHWDFPDNYPQEKMIADIENYMHNIHNSMMNTLNANPMQYVHPQNNDED